MKNTVLLTFDIEEFDTPLEYGKQLPWQEQIAVSRSGTEKILSLLHEQQVPATFYSTVSYAKEIPGLVKQLLEEGHELASHGMEHSKFSVDHLAASKTELEKLSGKKIYGYRMARMMPVDEAEVKNAGYVYNSSLNPTFIPGRYNNLHKPRHIFFKEGICQFPASVSTWLRMPLFWISFHNLPFSWYKFFCRRAMKKDKYLHLYFHPWEFSDITDKNKFGLPSYVSRNCGDTGISRLRELIVWLKQQGVVFETTHQFLLKEGSIQ